jgi:apolipoprotein D and lipocalin family protein
MLAAVLVCVGCRTEQPLATVEQVDLDRYAGRWYEIVRLPQFFERNCAYVTAEYSATDGDYIEVVNTCLDTLDQAFRSSKGKAFPVEGSRNSQLKVQFFFPFRGDYFIIDLDEDYQWAMVGSPSRSSLWILSRSPGMELSTINELLDEAKEKGFDTEAVIYTQHSTSCYP